MTAPILVTGGSGQLATALAEAAPAHGLAVHRVGRPVLDFDRPGSATGLFAGGAPSLVVNAAAYTAVDAAEDDEDAAFRANRDGPAELARLCETAGIPLIHVSTDYVFDGLKGAPYVETDATSPQGVYGASKLAGEGAVLAACSRAIVLRTSWVYSPVGRNFVRTMLAAGQRNDRLRVVADQTGCPTSAPDLARGHPGRGVAAEGRWLAGSLRGHLPRGRNGRRDLARSGDRDVRRSGAAWAGCAGGGADRNGGVADQGDAAAGLQARLRQAGGGVRGEAAGVAGGAGADRGRDLRPGVRLPGHGRPWYPGCLRRAWGIV